MFKTAVAATVATSALAGRPVKPVRSYDRGYASDFEVSGDFENKARDFEGRGDFDLKGDFENKARDFEVRGDFDNKGDFENKARDFENHHEINQRLDFEDSAKDIKSNDKEVAIGYGKDAYGKQTGFNASALDRKGDFGRDF